MGMLIYFITTGIIGIIFGKVTQGIIKHKGYDENWFWWGFFFGLLAVVVAFVRPNNPWYHPSSPKQVNPTFDDDDDDKMEEIKKYQKLLDAGIINEDDFNRKKAELLKM